MGNCLSYALVRMFHFSDFGEELNLSKECDQLYAVADPNQLLKPEGRTKDYISARHMNCPTKLDSDMYSGCDTIWKCFKRSVWLAPDKPFLGHR